MKIRRKLGLGSILVDVVENKHLRDVVVLAGQMQQQLKSWRHIVQVLADVMALDLCLVALLVVQLEQLRKKKSIKNLFR